MATTNLRTIKLVQLALFTAIIAIMNLTPLGYIQVTGIAITLLGIPVTVGAIFLGPLSGAILGGVFGLTSFIRCFGLDPFGVFLLGINPVLTFILCLVPRILMGWLAGFIFLGMKKVDKKKNIAFAVTNLAGPLLNTVLFMGTLVLFFYNNATFSKDIVAGTGATNVIAFIIAAVGVNALVEAGTCFVIGTAVSKVLDVAYKK